MDYTTPNWTDLHQHDSSVSYRTRVDTVQDLTALLEQARSNGSSADYCKGLEDAIEAVRHSLTRSTLR